MEVVGGIMAKTKEPEAPAKRERTGRWVASVAIPEAVVANKNQAALDAMRGELQRTLANYLAWVTNDGRDYVLFVMGVRRTSPSEAAPGGQYRASVKSLLRDPKRAEVGEYVWEGAMSLGDKEAAGFESCALGWRRVK